MLEFNLPTDKNNSSIIKVIGVGGGGSNAVNHMYKHGITGVDFIVCNTDSQALAMSPVPYKIQLGSNLTEGRGAGAKPEVGRNAALESIDEIKKAMGDNTKMLFITAGMGGGTGTGAAPVIAGVAKEMGILTVGIVTIPFHFEGPRRKKDAESGLEELSQSLDTLLIISNEKLRLSFGNMKMSEALAKADDILKTAAKSIAELITVSGYINVDFEDVKEVMTNSGVAIMGSGMANGDNRALNAVKAALESPLLNDNHINGANNLLLFITSGSSEETLDENDEITNYVSEQAGINTNVIWGKGYDSTLGDNLLVTIIATGFPKNSDVMNSLTSKKPETVRINLSNDANTPTLANTSKTTEVDPDAENKNETIIENTVEANAKKQSDINDKTVENEEFPFTLKTIEPSEPVLEKSELPFTVKEKSTVSEKDKELEERMRIHHDRIKKAKEFNFNNRSPKAIDELERTPAYLRNDTVFGKTPHSSDPVQSKYEITVDEKNNATVRPNNSFLHIITD